jgi:pteridine reductase
MQRLAGQVAVVTGASRGAGLGIARVLGEEAATVYVTGRSRRENSTRPDLPGATIDDTAEQVTARGGVGIALGCDHTSDEQVEALFARVAVEQDRLDLLVNNAAIWSPTPLAKAAADDVRRFFEVNTVSTFVCCQQAGMLMAAQPSGGAIINIGDWATARPYRDYAPYFTSKGAIPTLTRAFAVELAPRVRVNAILPGPVMLPDELSAEVRERAIAGTLVRRAGRPEHVAQAVLFLAENDFVTGVCLPVDGGRSIGNVD